ncbi:MAG: hypothetical protein ACI4MJ_04195 [Aristaeellaceae bacterium]
MKRIPLWTSVIGVALLATGFILLDEVRTGASMACNALFSASEEVNNYAYIRIALPPDADGAACQMAFGHWLAMLMGMVAAGMACSQSAAMPLGGAWLVIALEIYFGIVPATAVQLMLLGCLGMLVIRNMAGTLLWRDITATAAVVLVIGLLVALLLPGVHAATESYSEKIRDWLSTQQPGGTTEAAPEDMSLNHLRQETLLTQENAAAASKDGMPASGYERQQKFQRDISDPRPVNYLKTMMLFLLMIVLLVGPFVPFVWFDRRKRGALAVRKAFDAQDPAEAIAAMFPHIARCLTAIGIHPDNRGFPMLEGQLPDAYWAAYHQGVVLWQEAVYSNHPMHEEQKEQVKALLKQTEQLVYERADRRQRFRLQYVDALILMEELE